MTYQGVFKYLPQVIVIMRNVIIGCGNEPPKLVAVCYVHEDSLQHTGKRKSVAFAKVWNRHFCSGSRGVSLMHAHLCKYDTGDQNGTGRHKNGQSGKLLQGFIYNIAVENIRNHSSSDAVFFFGF